jgi:hypothetical protein
MVEYRMVPVRDNDEAMVYQVTKITEQQMDALTRKWNQDAQGISLIDFIKSAVPTFGCDGAIAVRWCGMWLCIERDGYCHS